jgi:mono/diheme cytochrome c family protein
MEAFENGRYESLKTPSDDPNPSDQEKELRHKINTVKACLRCHATWPKSNDPDHAHQAPVALELGVTCQACHGPGRRWEEAHRFDQVWRVITPEAKASLGFYDVRSPVKKAQLCASCHVGDLEQGKFVTHEWYAGGHPPLPSFELANFQRQMPVHWKPLAEKKDFKYRHGMLGTDDRMVANAIKYYTEDARGPKLPVSAIKSNYVEANFGSPDAKAEHDLTQSRDAIVPVAKTSLPGRNWRFTTAPPVTMSSAADSV